MPSSAIRAFTYNESRKQLRVTFVTGRIYLYDGVPPQVYLAFLAARSKGTFFNRFIRDHYPYREVERFAG
jgi:KTSC domain-containing protein